MKIKLRSFKSSEHINEKRDGSYRGRSSFFLHRYCVHKEHRPSI